MGSGSSTLERRWLKSIRAERLRQEASGETRLFAIRPPPWRPTPASPSHGLSVEVGPQAVECRHRSSSVVDVAPPDSRPAFTLVAVKRRVHNGSFKSSPSTRAQPTPRSRRLVPLPETMPTQDFEYYPVFPSIGRIAHQEPEAGLREREASFEPSSSAMAQQTQLQKPYHSSQRSQSVPEATRLRGLEDNQESHLLVVDIPSQNILEEEHSHNCCLRNRPCLPGMLCQSIQTCKGTTDAGNDNALPATTTSRSGVD